MTASSDAGLSTGTYAGLATSLQGVVSSTQAFVEALSGAKTLDAEAALLRNAAVGAQAAAALALDGVSPAAPHPCFNALAAHSSPPYRLLLSPACPILPRSPSRFPPTPQPPVFSLLPSQLVQGAPWRAQFVTMLPFLIPLSAAALAAQNAASRSGSGAATGYGTGVIGVGGRAVQQGPIPEEYALLSYDPDVYMKYFLRRPVFALWCAGARLVAPLTPSFSIFVRTTFSAEPACCIQAIRELSMVF